MIKIAIGNSNWDYYINENKVVFAIAKKDGCDNTYFGSLKYFLNLYREKQIAVLTVEAIEMGIMY
jgi:hypothetical protein